MHYLFLKLLLENPPLRNLSINTGLLKCCLAMYVCFCSDVYHGMHVDSR